MKDLVNGAGNEFHFTSYWSLLSWLMWNIYMNVWSSRLNMDSKPHLYNPGFFFWMQTRCIKTASCEELFHPFRECKAECQKCTEQLSSPTISCADWNEIVINFSAASTTAVCQMQIDKRQTQDSSTGTSIITSASTVRVIETVVISS